MPQDAKVPNVPSAKSKVPYPPKSYNKTNRPVDVIFIQDHRLS